MATFTNQATLRYNGNVVNSNITTGPVGPMGVIYSHISDGTPAQYREFTQLLESEGVKVEVL